MIETKRDGEGGVRRKNEALTLGCLTWQNFSNGAGGGGDGGGSFVRSFFCLLLECAFT